MNEIEELKQRIADLTEVVAVLAAVLEHHTAPSDARLALPAFKRLEYWYGTTAGTAAVRRAVETLQRVANNSVVDD